MDAAVVVPAYDEREHIASTLDSLAGQGARVVVVAGGEDGTEQRARSHPTTDVVLADPTCEGPGPARNRGVRATDADVICFTDADTVVPSGWVDRHLRYYRDRRVVGVGGPVRPLEGRPFDRALFRVCSDWWYRLSWPAGFVQASTNNCSYRREAFLDAGGFDEELSFLEDTDLSMRAKDLGRMVFDPGLPVRTSPRRQRAVGYGSLFLTYLVGYCRWVFGEDPGEGYFGEW